MTPKYEAQREAENGDKVSKVSAHNARLDALAKLVQETSVLRLRDAASRLGVSEITIRRDIAADGERLSCLGGYIIPVQDGAIRKSQSESIAMRRR